MNTNQEQYVCGAGHAHWRLPTAPERRRIWAFWLMSLLVFMGASVVIGLLLSQIIHQEDMTVKMERMVKHLERMTKVRPEVAEVIDGIISQPRYDCERVQCDPRLSERNRAVRATLTSLLAEKTSAYNFEITHAAAQRGPRLQRATDQ